MTGRLAAKFDLHVNLHVEQGHYNVWVPTC